MNNLLADTKLALELEIKGYELYKETASKSKNPLTKSVFSSLADRELVHLQKVKEYYKILTGESILKSDWMEEASIPHEKDELLKTIVSNLKNNLSKFSESQSDVNEAYLVAENLERESYKLYERLSSESIDQTIKSFFFSLAKEEQEHYDILDDTQLYLNDPAEWFKRQERWIVEGG